MLIAVGTLILSASGTLSRPPGQDRALAVTLLVGIAVLFGFVTSTTARRPVPAVVRDGAPAPAAAPAG